MASDVVQPSYIFKQGFIQYGEIGILLGKKCLLDFCECHTGEKAVKITSKTAEAYFSYTFPFLTMKKVREFVEEVLNQGIAKRHFGFLSVESYLQTLKNSKGFRGKIHFAFSKDYLADVCKVVFSILFPGHKIKKSEKGIEIFTQAFSQKESVAPKINEMLFVLKSHAVDPIDTLLEKKPEKQYGTLDLSQIFEHKETEELSHFDWHVTPKGLLLVSDDPVT